MPVPKAESRRSASLKLAENGEWLTSAKIQHLQDKNPPLKSVLLESSLLKQVIFMLAKPSRMFVVNCTNVNVNHEGFRKHLDR